MAMQLGSTGVKSDINVTPFVDIVLVLLIIFMVVTPLLSRALDISVPPKSEAQAIDVVTAGDKVDVRVEVETIHGGSRTSRVQRAAGGRTSAHAGIGAEWRRAQDGADHGRVR